MQNWKNLYLELAEKLNTIADIKWIDLWHNQVNFLEEEHAFPAPAVFLEFRGISPEDMGQNTQSLTVQVNVYLFYETFLETGYHNYNTEDAVAFLDTFTEIHKVLHGTSGTNYSSMRRLDFAPIDTGSAQNLYVSRYNCLVTDDSTYNGGNDVVDDDGDGENEWAEYQVDFN